MLFDLLHFGDGPQAINYFILCFFAILGTLQFVAIRYNRRDLIWLGGQAGIALSMVLIAGSFIWFFATDKEIYIPGLAGGELFTIFVFAIALTVPTTRALAFVFASLQTKLGNLPVSWGLLRRPASHNDREPMI